MGFREEFDDFPASDWPTMPAGFDDSSWGSDACPSAQNSDLGLLLWIDYADPAKSEYPEARAAGELKRFTLCAMYEGQGPHGWQAQPLNEREASPAICESDDFTEILAALAWSELADWFEHQADLKHTAATLTAGFPESALYMAAHEAMKARAAAIYEQAEG
jgi:hypothetical protein